MPQNATTLKSATVLKSATIPRLSLPKASREAWLREALALTFPTPCDPARWQTFVEASTAMAKRNLAPEIAEGLAEFFAPDGPDALVLENLPVDPALPPPPADGKRPASKQAVSEAVIAGLVGQHAAIVTYSNEKGGAPIHEITPVEGLENQVASTGRVPFACHTDAAFLAPRFCPRGLLLFGLLNEPAAPTAVLPVDRIVEAASPKLLHLLQEPIFRHPSPSSFEVRTSALGPILWRDPQGVFRIAVQTHAVQHLSEEARGAIAQLRALLDTLETERVVLGPGDALLFRNDRVLHGRDAFTGRRWLQRAYFTDSLAPFRTRAKAPENAFAFDVNSLL